MTSDIGLIIWIEISSEPKRGIQVQNSFFHIIIKKIRFFAPAAKGTLINSTGAGDSMVGGFLAEFTHSGDFAKALAMGTAAGGATAFSVGIAGFQKIMAVHESVKAGVQRVR